MRLKPGVRVQGLKPEALIALMVAEWVYDQHGYELVVTSGTDGRHSPGSYHYTGEAIDIRTNTVPEHERPVLCSEIAARLGPAYDVILEPDHMHIEHDP